MKKPKKTRKVGSRLGYSAGAPDRYQKALSKEIGLMARDYARAIKRTEREVGYTQDASISSQMSIMLNELSKKWESRFIKLSNKLVPALFKSIDKSSKNNLQNSLGQMMGVSMTVPDMPASLQDLVKASVVENVQLIRSVGTQFRERANQSVMRSISQDGLGRKTIYEHLTKYEGMGAKRAKLIANDQSRKVTSMYNVERMKSTGIKRWGWIHSGGGAEPRKLHKWLDGQEFDFDNPPIIDSRTGERGFPGQLIHCSCTMQPVFELELEE